MPGTKAGGVKAAATNKVKHGSDFYARIGAEGGKSGNTGGFAKKIPCRCRLIKDSHYLRQCAGLKGGRKSKRGPNRG